MAKIRGIRGATIADDNTQQAILEATLELLTVMVASNDVDVDDIAAAYFTTTQDLNAEFPAAAAPTAWLAVRCPPVRPRNEGAQCHGARHPRHAPRQHRQGSLGDRVPVSPWYRRPAEARRRKLDTASSTRRLGRIDMKDWDLQTLFDRGMLDDAIVRDELFDDITNGKRLTIYQGLDPTSPNMHIGHLVGLRVLRWFQLHGHHVILLIGDFTGRIGDPSDRPEARKAPHTRAGARKRRDVRRAVLKDLRSRWREPRADSVQLTVARQHHPRGVHRDHGQVHRPAASRTQHVSGAHKEAGGPVPQRDDLPHPAGVRLRGDGGGRRAWRVRPTLQYDAGPRSRGSLSGQDQARAHHAAPRRAGRSQDEQDLRQHGRSDRRPRAHVLQAHA